MSHTIQPLIQKKENDQLMDKIGGKLKQVTRVAPKEKDEEK